MTLQISSPLPHLVDQLSGGGHAQRHGPIALHQRRLVLDMPQHGQHKCQRLAAAGLGNADAVPPAHDDCREGEGEEECRMSVQGERSKAMERQGCGAGEPGAPGVPADSACNSRYRVQAAHGEDIPPSIKAAARAQQQAATRAAGSQLTRQRLGLDGQRALKAALFEHIQDAGAQAALHWEGGGVRGGMAVKNAD